MSSKTRYRVVELQRDPITSKWEVTKTVKDNMSSAKALELRDQLSDESSEAVQDQDIPLSAYLVKESKKHNSSHSETISA